MEKGTNTRTDRTNQMVMLAYFLVKYGEKSPEGKNVPPKELLGQSFNKILESFHPALGDGRTLKRFKGSMNGLLTYFRSPENMRVWLIENGANNPWVAHSRDQLWSQLQRLRAAK
jgi:hypothetical protein